MLKSNDVRKMIAQEFGLPVDSVTDAFLLKATTDPSFLDHLDVCRNDADMLSILLREVGINPRGPRNDWSSSELLVQAGSAFARWALGRFAKVQTPEYQRRLLICNECEHLSSANSSLIYKLIGLRESELKVCGLCGCDVRRKALLATEICPASDYGEQGKWTI